MKGMRFYVFLVLLSTTLLNFSCDVKQEVNTEETNENHSGEPGQIDARNSNVKDYLLRRAYEKGDYDQVLYYLETGSSGKVILRDGKTPLLLDIYSRYEDGDSTVNDLFNYFLENGKDCFEEEIGLFDEELGHTIGSYIASFGALDTLEKLVQSNININAKNLATGYTPLFFVASSFEDHSGNIESDYGLVNGNEKLKRLNLLLDGGADVTLRGWGGGTIFHYFSWWPLDEDFENVLDRFSENGADITAKDDENHSPISLTIYPMGLITNSEAYITYLINHGVKITDDDYSALHMLHKKNTAHEFIEIFDETQGKYITDVRRSIDDDVLRGIKELEKFLNAKSDLTWPWPIEGY